MLTKNRHCPFSETVPVLLLICLQFFIHRLFRFCSFFRFRIHNFLELVQNNCLDPGIKLTLLDSLNKRVKFLEEVCDALELKNVEFIHVRAEDIGRQKEHREMYDLCVSRAVANLASLSEYCMPFVKIGGFFVPYKSGEIEDELKSAGRAVGILGGELEFVDKFMLPGTDASRSLVVIKKVKGISKKYPRKAGMPTKEPLG